MCEPAAKSARHCYRQARQSSSPVWGNKLSILRLHLFRNLICTSECRTHTTSAFNIHCIRAAAHKCTAFNTPSRRLAASHQPGIGLQLARIANAGFRTSGLNLVSLPACSKRKLRWPPRLAIRYPRRQAIHAPVDMETKQVQCD
jgi:hypothetical protein